MNALLTLIVAWMVWASPAQAQDLTVSFAAPPVRVVPFQGVPEGACDPTLAQAGQCIDRVSLFPHERAWGQEGKPTAYDHAYWRLMGPLHFQSLEALTYQWNKGDIEQTLLERGYSKLPRLSKAWARGALRSKTYSLPPLAHMRGLGEWFDHRATSREERNPSVYYPIVRYVGPATAVELPVVLVLKGRFARNLGYDKRKHDYDLMDADPSSNGPFLEQFFPYSGVTSGVMDSPGRGAYDDREALPLDAFRKNKLIEPKEGEDLPPQATVDSRVLVEIDRFDEVALAAREHYLDLLRVIYVQAGQYALSNFTINQVRVMAALSAISTPPSQVELETGFSRHLNAGTQGVTDTPEEAQIVRQPESLRPAPVSHLVRYEVLPRTLLLDWIQELIEDGVRPDMQAIENRVVSMLGSKLMPSKQRLDGLSETQRNAWLRARLMGTEDPVEADLMILRTAVAHLLSQVGQTSPAQKDRLDTLILHDHGRRAIAGAFDPEVAATPSSVAEQATQLWSETMLLHGHATQHISQGLGAVNPLAVCGETGTLQDLEAPSFRRVKIDLLVEGPPGLEDEAVLWQARAKAPFIMIDNPLKNTPTVVEMVKLGSSQALYRVRFEVWSGWHLFWNARSLPNNKAELVLRTGAICADTVLTHRELAPSIIRAGLLWGNFRPTVPQPLDVVRRAKREARKAKRAQTPSADGDDLVAGAADTQAKAAEAQAQAEAAEAAIREPDLEGLASSTPSFGEEKAFEIVKEPLSWQSEYMRRLVHRPLLADHGAQGVLVQVFDGMVPSRSKALRDGKPRTPYFRAKTKIKKTKGSTPSTGEATSEDAKSSKTGRHLYAAGWTWYLDNNLSVTPLVVSPGFESTESVLSGAAGPRWKRRKALDFWLSFGVGGFPIRQANSQCNPEYTGGSATVPSCDALFENQGTEDDPFYPVKVYSQGLSLDLGGLATLWFTDKPRMAIEVGFELRADIVNQGQSWLASAFQSSDSTDVSNLDLGWSFRPQGGLLLGFRHAPLGFRLHRSSIDRATWGAPRASGKSRAVRTQWGLRTGFLYGPSTLSSEGTLLGEAWVGWSVRQRKSRVASFTPYRPKAFYGPFVRYQYGFPMSSNQPTESLFWLRNSSTVIIGFRGQLRLSAAIAKPGK